MNFQNYHLENPEIWNQFVKFAHEAKAKGFRTYSAKGIFELIRWHTSTTGNDGFKLNNNYHADYARLFMQKFPAFQGFFNVRELKVKR